MFCVVVLATVTLLGLLLFNMAKAMQPSFVESCDSSANCDGSVIEEDVESILACEHLADHQGPETVESLVMRCLSCNEGLYFTSGDISHWLQHNTLFNKNDSLRELEAAAWNLSWCDKPFSVHRRCSSGVTQYRIQFR